MKKVILALTLAVSMFATSCSTTWLQTFDGYVTLAAPAVVEIVTAIDAAEGVAVNAATLKQINDDAAALKNLGQSVIDATDANLPTTCAAFNQAVQTFAADVPSLEQLNGIKDPVKLAEITAGITLVQGVIAAIEQPVSACQTAPSSAAARKALYAGVSQIQSPSQFVVNFNKLNLGKKLHVNPWYVRFITFGRAK